MPTISRELLTNIFSKASSTIEKGHTVMEILKTAKVTIGDGHMSIESTNLEVALSLSAPLDTNEKFVCCVDPRKVSALLKNMPDETVTFGFSQDTQEFFVQGKNTEYRFSVFPAEDFPEIPQKEKALLTVEEKGEVLANLLTACLYAASNDETQSPFCGVCFDFNTETPALVATDNRRLASASTGWSVTNGVLQGVRILPAKAVRTIVKFARETEHVKIHFFEEFVGVELTDPAVGEVLMMIRPIAGGFPDWREVLPTDPPALKMTVNVKDFKAALHRMKEVLKQERHPAVFLNFTDSGVKVTTVQDSESPSAGVRGAEHVDVEVEGEFEEKRVAFNLSYLYDLFSALTCEQAVLELWEKNRPARVKDREFLHLLMPMAL